MVGYDKSADDETGSPSDVEVLRRELRRLREERGISQVELAEKLHVTQAAVSAFERGKNRSMRKATLEKIRQVVSHWRKGSNIVQFDSSDEPGLPAFSKALLRELAGDRGPDRGADETSGHGELLDALRHAVSQCCGEDEVTSELVHAMDLRELILAYLLSRKA